MGSCVGWATAYAAFAISATMNSENVSGTNAPEFARSPLYIYNQIKINGCVPGGAHIDDALQLVKTTGACKFTDFSPNDCFTLPGEREHTLAREFRIKEYYRIFDLNEFPENKVAATINSLKAKRPVVVGMAITDSFDNLPPGGHWEPHDDESVTGGHALCVIGFDNNTQRFEIINSWGTEWGNDGFFTISYSDYGRHCKYGYQFSTETRQTTQTSLSGVFRFKKYQGFNAASNQYEFADIKPTLTESNNYTFTSGMVRKDDFFRIVASDIKKDNFVYIFSIKPNNDSEILFPLNLSADGATIKDIPIVPSDRVSIEIPLDEKKGITTDQAGDDFLCILYSRQQIEDIRTVVDNVTNSSGEFYDRLRNALGNRLIPAHNIKYQKDFMQVSATSPVGYIAPIILKVHVLE
ncbi:MAG: C1 family peptidase [Bacteroidota bacterium]